MSNHVGTHREGAGAIQQPAMYVCERNLAARRIDGLRNIAANSSVKSLSFGGRPDSSVRNMAIDWAVRLA